MAQSLYIRDLCAAAHFAPSNRPMTLQWSVLPEQATAEGPCQSAGRWFYYYALQGELVNAPRNLGLLVIAQGMALL